MSGRKTACLVLSAVLAGGAVSSVAGAIYNAYEVRVIKGGSPAVVRVGEIDSELSALASKLKKTRTSNILDVLTNSESTEHYKQIREEKARLVERPDYIAAKEQMGSRMSNAITYGAMAVGMGLISLGLFPKPKEEENVGEKKNGG
jgi:hypothetical protein